MTNFFDHYPEFINSDNRIARHDPTDGYPVSADFLAKRYACMMPTARCSGKRILDLGSCTASLGAWCLDNGAASYTGIELQKKFVETSKTNLSKYFKSDWRIIESSIEDFLANNRNKYDVVVASGVLYSVTDVYGCLKALTDISNYIIVEAKHPFTVRTAVQSYPNKTEFFEFEKPVIDVGQVQMIYEESNTRANALGFAVSIGALTTILQSMDFVPDRTVYTNLKETLGDVYGFDNPYKRFGIGFQRSTVDDKLVPFVESYQNPELLSKALRTFSDK
jgi:precorrin-6B methylase 2